MTYRHIHCVYFKTDADAINGTCLLKNKEIDFGFKECCKHVVYRPSTVISCFLHIENGDDWATSDYNACEFIKNEKVNDYPMELKE